MAGASGLPLIVPQLASAMRFTAHPQTHATRLPHAAAAHQQAVAAVARRRLPLHRLHQARVPGRQLWSPLCMGVGCLPTNLLRLQATGAACYHGGTCRWMGPFLRQGVPARTLRRALWCHPAVCAGPQRMRFPGHGMAQ